MTTQPKSAKTPAAGDLKVTPSPEKIESTVSVQSKEKGPVDLEVQSLDEEPVAAPEPAPKEAIETDVRKKLARKTDDMTNPFVPTNPAQVEADAKKVADENGFELNRGTSVGARLMARAQSLPRQ